MRIVEEGVVSAPEPGTARAVAKQVHSALLPDGEILVAYRIGAASDTENGTAELRRSRDGGRTWSEPETPWPTSFGGRRGTIYAPTLTVLGRRRTCWRASSGSIARPFPARRSSTRRPKAACR